MTKYKTDFNGQRFGLEGGPYSHEVNAEVWMRASAHLKDIDPLLSRYMAVTAGHMYADCGMVATGDVTDIGQSVYQHSDPAESIYWRDWFNEEDYQ